jgi:hypothetical protein
VINERDQIPGRVAVRFDQWREYNPEGWEFAQVNPDLLYWLARQVHVMRRQFLVIDHGGAVVQIAAIVNARIAHVGRERRLFCVYTIVENKEGGGWTGDRCSWGEVIFLDSAPRIPVFDKRTPRSWYLWGRERLRAWRKKWAKGKDSQQPLQSKA